MGSSTTDISPAYADDSGSRLERGQDDLRKTLLAGIIGAVVAAGAYFIYSRLEDEQKEQLRRTVGRFVEDKIADVRAQFKV
ncbi:MAG: hypothetical protein JO343_05440 [Candidatus Eremiobacteraeota bacterium]|nr:hypothetical protein [Candidatus Eremiobacteraeota bacterium]MBV8460792.1 hypothetical protein [Candidatus Eremiobacteraeota bacterium]MBV8596114.1 hypothetical protein [Candidatus Eremiobacteraeota bacterium]MBV8669615.1 hypothetical protein [Candidatus Eremiobacteraeota bacterium]